MQSPDAGKSISSVKHQGKKNQEHANLRKAEEKLTDRKKVGSPGSSMLIIINLSLYPSSLLKDYAFHLFSQRKRLCKPEQLLQIKCYLSL
jgi:hypothetical protein